MRAVKSDDKELILLKIVVDTRIGFHARREIRVEECE